ncbi:uncharacterized protein LOC129769318 [Toxorhynchites rutilus septentrionalis]|uniref:uncharacterized protein LOC129769318 n=1 Tax=Toxorhynchites rutilus septentrionalis TaxID=329112 RepID=UPI00247A6112|nr:uncharacterized protein LOC129769318 [Toxorhynchites rutilus septentrionalis]XP_055627463.1 uncharacterized protein LOC129769318 [Toxorhynchites rutilus septentrionalis]XP_055627464.1 uncharacterized protein LOC129769318 [Toxorhynchites rutilus septentrionalis]
MGNTLCKEPNVNSSLRPGRILDNFGSLVCPNGIGKSKTGINKTYLSRHVLETGPKSNTLNSWQSAELTVPDGTKVIDRAPVAPPRRKRSTLERDTSLVALKVKNGFKDVFGAESRRQSSDVQPKPLPKREDTSDAVLPSPSQTGYEIDASNDAFSDFSKVPTSAETENTAAVVSDHNATKPSKVGNKKSDKFFGENLSVSLSENSVVPETKKDTMKDLDELDKIDQFIEKNVLNKRASLVDQKEQPVKATKTEAQKAEMKAEKDYAAEELAKEQTLIKYIDEAVGKDLNMGKKAEFLMAMLEDYPEDLYIGMTPVEEPTIVPRKRKTRHICEDEEHMHNLLHEHEMKSSQNLITTEASIETPPRKPSRDFSKYLNLKDGYSDSDDSSFTRPVRKHRPSRKNLPAAPMRPKLPKSMSESQFQFHSADASTPKKLEDPENAKAHTPKTLKRIISMPTTASLLKGAESRSSTPQPILTKSNSSSSFLIMDLQKDHISVGRFTPEDHQHNAADELVAPKSRLKTRKISIRSSEGGSCAATPTKEMPPPRFTIGSREVIKSSPNPPEVPKRAKHVLIDSLVSDRPNKKPIPAEILGYDLGGFLESSKVLPHHDITNVIEYVYNSHDSNENIIEDFQNYLEEQINSEINDPNSKNPNVAKLLEILNQKQEKEEEKLEDVNIDLVETDCSNKSSDMDDCFDPEFEKIEKIDVEDKDSPKECHQSVENVSDWLESASDAESVVEVSDKLGNMVHVKNHPPRRMRSESIEDVDSWFKNHNESIPGEEIIGVRKKRRGSDGFIVYDTSKQYPFGVVRHRRDSLSAEMFEDITKLHEMGVSKDKPNSSIVLAKNHRLQERRGSDGLILYDTQRRYPFGEPNTDLPRALEEESRKHNTNNETTVAITNADDGSKKLQSASDDSDHSKLLKFLSTESLLE